MLGIFDSGIGGLMIAKEIIKTLPQYQVVYLGDTARLPYGDRSQKLIYQFTEQAVNFLHSKYNCPLTIIACNTASAEALRKIQQQWLPTQKTKKRVLGVIRPMAEMAAQITKNNRIGVIGTTGTIESKAYINELKAQQKTVNKKFKIFQKATPLLVPMIEEGWKNKTKAKKVLIQYLKPLRAKKIDTLILGCTHYQMIHNQVKKIMGKNCIVLSPAHIIAKSLKDYLKRHPEIENKIKKGKNNHFLVTDITAEFEQNASSWLGKKIKLEKINLK